MLVLALGVLALGGCEYGCRDQAFAASRLSTASETCIASVFSEGYSRPMADGRRHRPSELLVAHRTLPLGSRVRLMAVATGGSVIATVRDRGPFVRGRCVDVSPAVNAVLRFDGLARVTVTPVFP